MESTRGGAINKWGECKHDGCDKWEDAAAGSSCKVEVVRFNKVDTGAEPAMVGAHILRMGKERKLKQAVFEMFKMRSDLLMD